MIWVNYSLFLYVVKSFYLKKIYICNINSIIFLNNNK